jgi:DNA-binding response OmpR family regulator
LERILRAAGYEVITATDGNQAIEMMLEERPSLMVLDVKMPTLDGYGVCEKLNQLGPRAKRPPVVFLTSLRSKALELLGHEFGAYLHKPVQGDELLQVVGEQISRTSMTAAVK